MSNFIRCHAATHCWLGLLLALSACSDGGGRSNVCEDTECLQTDAGRASTHADPATPSDGGKSNPFLRSADGAIASLDPDQPLQTHIQVSGTKLPCGACYVMSAQAQGGLRPYSYAWSDPSLQGPGPHQVCPSAPTTYTVTVMDSTPNVSGEFASSTELASDTSALDCVADAGPDVWAGCLQPDVQDAGAKLDCDGMNSLDAGVLNEQGFSNMFSTSSLLVEPMVAGKTYSYDYDQILPLHFGDSITVEVFGAMHDKPCEPLTKLFTLSYDDSWHQSYCFTADRAYERTVARTTVKGILLSFDLGTVGTLCKGCSDSAPDS